MSERKRGHSNIKAHKTAPWKDLPECANIPLCGGASVQSVKTLPPLAMRQDEWREIGQKMGWSAASDLAAYGLLVALNDCAECLERLDDKDGAFRRTCLAQARAAIRKAEGRTP